MDALERDFLQLDAEHKYDQPAKRLKEKLTPLSSHIDIYQKRWFWELLQNACDYNTNVKIQLEVDDQFVYFRHNGKAFTPRDAKNLIHPDSGKDLDSSNSTAFIGKFGTGFLSTHILSARIRVSGQIVDSENKYFPFTFNLDRSQREDRSALVQSLKNSEAELKSRQSVVNLSNTIFKTEFAYYRNSSYSFVNFDETLNAGLQFVKATLPYVFAFVPQLEEVEVIQKNLKFYFKRLPANNGCFYRSDGAVVETRTIHVVQANVSGTQVAALVENDKISPVDEIPKLFCAYPLIGSEAFPFPCVVNNTTFIPTTERSGIELSDTDTVNRAILKDAYRAYFELINLVEGSTYLERYRISKIAQPHFNDGFINIWYKKEITDVLRSRLVYAKFVYANGYYNKLESLYIPYPEKEEEYDAFYSLCSGTTISIPDASESRQWYEVIDFSLFPKLKLDIDKLTQEIAPTSSFINLQKFKQPENVIQWMLKLVGEIIKHRKINLLQNHNLIPLKSGGWAKQKEQIFWDDNIPVSYKEIYMLLTNDDFNKFLIHDHFTGIGDSLLPLATKKTVQDIAALIDASFKDVHIDNITPNYVSALQKLFGLTDDLDYEQQRNLFPIFSANKARLLLDTFKTDKERDLAFEIIKSDQKEVLAQIAKANIPTANLLTMAQNPNLVNAFIIWYHSIVDDKENADADLGNIGEEYIYKWLLNKYKNQPEITVEWVAKTRNEANYDFVVSKSGAPWIFIDAKTTGKGIANGDSVPFFMRMGQWNFLPTLDNSQYYIIARVFVNNGSISHRFINISHSHINES